MWLKSLSGAMLIVLTPANVAAEIMVAPTLEWLADHCVDSGLYRVTGVQKNAEVTESYVVKFERQKSLRGEPKNTTEQSYFQFRLDARRKRQLVRVGDEFLICFQHLSDGARIAAHLINLSSPQTDGPTFIAVSSDFRILKDRQAIVDVFLNRLKRQPKGEPVMYGDHSKDNRIELSPSMEPYAALYSGSSCYLMMPKNAVSK